MPVLGIPNAYWSLLHLMAEQWQKKLSNIFLLNLIQTFHVFFFWIGLQIALYVIKCLIRVWNIKYNSIHCAANLLAGIVQYYVSNSQGRVVWKLINTNLGYVCKSLVGRSTSLVQQCFYCLCFKLEIKIHTYPVLA